MTEAKLDANEPPEEVGTPPVPEGKEFALLLELIKAAKKVVASAEIMTRKVEGTSKLNPEVRRVTNAVGAWADKLGAAMESFARSDWKPI